MEKKTIGKFISVLRRAAGMTQKELGERLFVSDKTVSRWERDECTPELSLLPAIAEIFGITTDELLRGERSQGGETTLAQKNRSDKQLRIMLHNRMVRFRNMCVISLGVAAAAAIVTFVINESFYKGTLAFGIGAVIIVAAFVCQYCFASASMLRLDEEDGYVDEIQKANSKVVTATAGVLIAIMSVFAFILPIGIFGSSYYALGTAAALSMGAGCSLLAVIIGHVAYVLWGRKALENRGLIFDEEKESVKIKCRRKLLVRTVQVSGGILLFLAAALAANMTIGPEVYCRQKNTFSDPEEFQKHMYAGAVSAWQYETMKDYGPEAIAGYECIFIDYRSDGMYDDVLLPPKFETAQIRNEDGTVLCDYANHPGFVRDVSWDRDAESGGVEITTRTIRSLETTEQICGIVRAVILVLMMADVVTAVLVYLVKLARKKG